MTLQDELPARCLVQVSSRVVFLGAQASHLRARPCFLRGRIRQMDGLKQEAGEKIRRVMQLTRELE